MRRTLIASASLLAALASSSALASSLRVEVSRDSKAVATTTKPVRVGESVLVDLTKPFAAVARCAARGEQQATLDGVGHSGLKVTVTPGSSNGRFLTTAVKVENGELVELLPMRAGPVQTQKVSAAEPCSGQTPAMLKWDASAAFELAPGQPQQFTVGPVTITLTLVGSAPEAAAVAQPQWLAL
nr:hypothetical protein [Dyella sp. ASV24]